MNIFLLGKIIGVIIMLCSLLGFVYMIFIGAADIYLWQIVGAFWFGSSVFWQSFFYEETR